MLQQSHSLAFDVVHAMDFSPDKCLAYDAMAAVKGFRPAACADISDEGYYDPAFFSSLGPVDLLVSAIPCKDFSPAGKGEGAAAARTSSFFRGLVRWIRLSRPALVVLECVKQLETASAAKRKQRAEAKEAQRTATAATDAATVAAAAAAAAAGGVSRSSAAVAGARKRARSSSRPRSSDSASAAAAAASATSDSDDDDADADSLPDIEHLLAPLRALGYGCRIGTLKADEWVAMRRTRLFVLLYRLDDAGALAAWNAPDEGFRLAVSPSRREVVLDGVILPPHDEELEAAFVASGAPETSRPCAPLSCYSVAKQALGTAREHAQSKRFSRVEALRLHARTGRSHVAVDQPKRLSVASGSFERRAGHARGGVRRRAMASTVMLSSSRCLVLADRLGPRTFTGLETARLFGYPEWATAAFYSVVKSDKLMGFVGDVSAWRRPRLRCTWGLDVVRDVRGARSPPSLRVAPHRRALRCRPSATCCTSCSAPSAS